MINANVLTQYDASSAHQAADTVATKPRAATNAAAALPVAAETASETVSLSPAALALQQGDASGLPPALTYSKASSLRRPADNAPQAAQPAPAAAQDITHKKLTDKLQAAGIATSPQFDVRMDNKSQQVQVLGNRPDAPRIEQVINNDPALQQALSNGAPPQAKLSAQPQPTQASKRLAASYQEKPLLPDNKNLTASA